MKRSYWINTALLDFIILNLFLTIVSLPLLVAWGLPLSWLSPIGNLIFSPFLSLFLLASTLSFFSELLHLPHALWDALLEYITASWYILLQIAPANSCIGFSTIALYGSSILALGAFFLVLLPQFNTTSARLRALTLLFFCSIGLLKATEPAQIAVTFSCIKKDLHLLRQNNQTMVIDGGACSERAQPTAWVQYHLIPDILRTTGSMRIEHLVLTRPTIRVFEAAAALMQQAEVHTLYFPAMEGELIESHRGIFRKLYAIAREKEVRLHRIHHEHFIKLGSQTVQIIPGKRVSYRSITYPSLNWTVH